MSRRAMGSTLQVYAELEIDLARVQAESYRVELRFHEPYPGPRHDHDESEKPRARGIADFDLDELATLMTDAEAYGRALSAQLFHDDDVRALYARAKTAVESRDLFLRLRLRVDPSAPELHALRWELLRDPETRAPLATSEKTPFSRFMASPDWRPIKLRRKTRLRGLVAVAAPSDLARYQLADVDRDGEIDRARTALVGVELEVLGDEEPLTMERLIARLRDGVDILYLVCHGALIRQVPHLYLQNEAGEVAVADGNALARRIAELVQPPRLAVLASCESARSDSTAGGDAPDRATPAEAALAPRLAEAGVPAILAMQGKISMRTIEQAMPVFFRELLRDGQIDRALAVARGVVRDRHDAWMPALYLRLRSGRIWYVPGFRGDSDFSKWRSITASVRRGTFIPILGTEVSEHVFGTCAELAWDLGDRHGFPLAAQDCSDLAKVTQFLTVDESREYAREQVMQELRRRLLAEHPELADEDATASLPRLLDSVVARQEDGDPLRILAELPAPLYVTAAIEPLLLKTLKAVGRAPTPLLAEWRSSADNHPSEPLYESDPCVERPVIYHPFGVLGKAHSLVLTEDDIYDYLIATAEYKLVPMVVRGALTRSSLLFLGFHFDTWMFRLLFRLIVNLGGHRQLRDYAHVGVQVDPSEHDLLDVERTRRYLESYFGTGGDVPPISIYWGTAADFLRELRVKLEQHAEDTDVSLTAEESEDEWLG